jgi:hypothetical protein
MNPYEKTAQEMKRQAQGPKRFAQTALSIGSTLGVASFAPVLAKAAPFLSQYIPENLAIKGLSKISPKMGKFVSDALNSGYDFGEVKNFIGDQIKESQTEQPKEKRNIIEQYSPELHSFIDQEIKKGRNPIEAGALAQNDKRFSEIIKKLSKDHKTPWSNILQGIYGNGQTAQPQQQASQQPGQSQQGGSDKWGTIAQTLKSILES